MRVLRTLAFLLLVVQVHAAEPTCANGELFDRVVTNSPDLADQFNAVVATEASPSQKVRASLKFLAPLKISGAQKAKLWAAFGEKLMADHPGSWKVTPGRTKDGSYLFRGAAGEILVIRESGDIYKGRIFVSSHPDYETPAENLIYVPNDWQPEQWLPNYDQLRNLSYVPPSP